MMTLTNEAFFVKLATVIIFKLVKVIKAKVVRNVIQAIIKANLLNLLLFTTGNIERKRIKKIGAKEMDIYSNSLDKNKHRLDAWDKTKAKPISQFIQNKILACSKKLRLYQVMNPTNQKTKPKINEGNSLNKDNGIGCGVIITV